MGIIADLEILYKNMLKEGEVNVLTNFDYSVWDCAQKLKKVIDDNKGKVATVIQNNDKVFHVDFRD
jgi:hypothetical protein